MLKMTKLRGIKNLSQREPIRRKWRREGQVIHPGIPGADNRWFASRGQAYAAANQVAATESIRRGVSCRVAEDLPHGPGQPRHLHIECPTETGKYRRFSGHFFYGQKPPCKASRFIRSVERESGPGTNRAMTRIFDYLRTRSGLTYKDAHQRIRQGQAQLNAAGKPVSGGSLGTPLTKPDLSYVDRRGRRINIEVDTTTSGSLAHQARVDAADPKAINYYLMIDPLRGFIRSARRHTQGGAYQRPLVGFSLSDLPELEMEYEALGELGERDPQVYNEVQATIDWKKIYTINNIQDAPEKGIYIVERNGKPVYVGITWTRSIGSRWKERVTTFRELKIPAPVQHLYKIRVGTITGPGQGPWRQRNVKDLYETVERVLIRYLLRVRRYGLSNLQSTRQFVVVQPGINVINEGKERPSYLPCTIMRTQGQVQEMSVCMPRYLQ